jgi:hypothetical protein
MKEEEIKNFIELNKESFKILERHIKNIDTVEGVDTLIEFKARQKAIRIINGWLTELWSVAYPELPQEDEDDNIFRTIVNS